MNDISNPAPDGPEDADDGTEPNAAPNAAPNPFAGTPFEQLFGPGGLGGLGGAGPMGGLGALAGMPGMAGGMPDLSALFGQIQSLMAPYDGPLNWDVAQDLARETAAQSPDPTPTQRQRDAVADALRLADHWLDETTDFASGITTSQAWSRADWVVNTLEVWKVLVEPVARQSIAAMSTALPAEAAAAAAPMMGILGKAVGAMLAQQVGSGLGTLATEVLSGSDIGVPLTRPGAAALLPANVEAFADGLGVPQDDVVLYLALREAAHQRLYAGVPWLRDHVLEAITDYASGITINVEGIQQRVEEQLRGVDPADPEAMQQLLESGMFELPDSPVQRAALERLEIVLALVEGWVDEVVSQATGKRMPDAGKVREAVRRRRAAGGPAEQTFASLVGLELRPRRLREAAVLWGSLRERQGAEARDGVWMSPHLLPTAADLDDPTAFRDGATAPAELSEADFDAELAALLDGPPASDPPPAAGTQDGAVDGTDDDKSAE